jgi:hypothetical protein
MQRLDHSLHAARGFLAFLLLVGGSLALGHRLDPSRGAPIGFVVGACLFACWVAWLKAARTRGDAWVQAGRELGLRSMYSGHAPEIPIPGHERPMELLSGTIGGATLLIGDRGEQFLQYHTDAPIGTWETATPEVSDPIPVESFIALWIPGLDEAPFRLGKRRSLFEGRETKPSGPFAETLESWSGAHSGWRMEGRADCLVLCRPNRLARIGELPRWMATARSLVEALGV